MCVLYVMTVCYLARLLKMFCKFPLNTRIVKSESDWLFSERRLPYLCVPFFSILERSFLSGFIHIVSVRAFGAADDIYCIL